MKAKRGGIFDKVRTCPRCKKSRGKALYSWSDTCEFMGQANDGACDICHKQDLRREARIDKEERAAARKIQKHLRMLEGKRKVKQWHVKDGTNPDNARQCTTCGDFYDGHRFLGHYGKIFKECTVCRRRRASRVANQKKRDETAHRRACASAAYEVKQKKLEQAMREERAVLKKRGRGYAQNWQKCKSDEAKQRNAVRIRYVQALLVWMAEEHKQGNFYGSEHYLTDEVKLIEFHLKWGDGGVLEAA